MMKRRLLIIALFWATNFSAQRYILDSILPIHGRVIHQEENQFQFALESPYFNLFFKRMDSIFEGKNDKLHIFHIGGSHIQADIYSNKLRTYLQNTNDVSMAQRGFIFPFYLAKTNNPSNYKISGTRDKWKGYRCSVTDSVAWGLSGISAAFREKSDTIYIKANHKNYTKNSYKFDKFRLFYNTWKNDYDIRFLDSTLVVSDTLNSDVFYKEYRFSSEVDSIAIAIQLKDSTNVNPEFLFMGAELMNSNPGIEYTSIGVNGASFAFYNRSAYFEKQLQLYKPDLFIISIGTNDAYMSKSQFDGEKFKNYYESFIQMIQRVNPNCAILLTVPNDSYYRKKIPNPNTATQQKIIYEITQKYQMAVWDFYKIMGGFGASNKWYQRKLMPRDRVHFTYLGYQIKADLLLNAFIDAWSKTTNRDKEQLLHHYKNLYE
ncbi:GDSL-type esterase/lipase family protein [Polaribacter sp.]|uniref:GDSL-type esterase/lipase family protein n=2 Tax=Polaribacter sp. TaxID=1920175 RepID=UPI004047B610